MAIASVRSISSLRAKLSSSTFGDGLETTTCCKESPTRPESPHLRSEFEVKEKMTFANPPIHMNVFSGKQEIEIIGVEGEEEFIDCTKRNFEDREIGLMVGKDAKISLQRFEIGPPLALFRRLFPSPLQVAALATYRVYLTFALPGASAIEPKMKVGTAVHIGEGLFLTTAHTFQWPEENGTCIYPRHDIKIYLRGGRGVLDGPNPGTLPKDFSAIIYAYSDSLTQQLNDAGQTVMRDNLLPPKVMLNENTDFVLLKASAPRWPTFLRGPRERQYRARPISTSILPHSLNAHLIAVHGATIDKTVYDEAANSANDFDSAITSLFPGAVARGSGVAYLVSRDATPAGTYICPNYIRYGIAALGGSSGGGIYDDNGRLFGIHFNSERDPNGKRLDDAQLNNALPLSTASFKSFIRAQIIPYFQNLPSKTAEDCREDWEAML